MSLEVAVSSSWLPRHRCHSPATRCVARRMASSSAPLPVEDVKRKVTEFEHFVHAKLEPDLKAVVEQRDGIHEEISE